MIQIKNQSHIFDLEEYGQELQMLLSNHYRYHYPRHLKREKKDLKKRNLTRLVPSIKEKINMINYAKFNHE